MEEDHTSVCEWCDVRKTQLAIASFEDGRGPRAKEWKSKETNSPVEPPEGDTALLSP